MVGTTQHEFHVDWASVIYELGIRTVTRKLDVIIWNKLIKGVQYSPPKEYLFLDQKRKLKLVDRIKINIVKYELKPEDVGFDKLLIISI